MVSFVLSIEGGGMAATRMLPSVMLEETAYYFNIRGMILRAKHEVDEYKRKRDARRRGR